jgi:hypothetical protein
LKIKSGESLFFGNKNNQRKINIIANLKKKISNLSEIKLYLQIQNILKVCGYGV